MTIGWKLTEQCRAALLAAYPARYANVVADHVTLSVGGTQAPHQVSHARIVGRADDGLGVEAMVVSIDDSTVRPDGKTWHITWSLAEGRVARESNDVIAELGWHAMDGGGLALFPAHW
ncbi:hypothetical protein OVA07_12480 [Novosphingobium sp. SL115]|uniref:hypothetical protein n=1 Tax=Novosphingobium sp. SL115 TaxID=2995150 RepID=UPI002272931A|nr:hypothetical protein [Novosphingobium sp. SL115]MCY1671817.1 hypothetical protein [Novosphingobium sp. SL115]